MVHICNYKYVYTRAYVRMYIINVLPTLPHIEVNQLEWDWFSRQLMRFILNLQSSGRTLLTPKNTPEKRCQSCPQKTTSFPKKQPEYKFCNFSWKKNAVQLEIMLYENSPLFPPETPTSCRVVARNVLPSNFSSDSSCPFDGNMFQELYSY